MDGVPGSWRMFALGSGAAATTADQANLLVITPSAVAGLDSAAIEDVLMLRDELAEMAWGRERTVVGTSGFPLDRGLAWRTSQPPATPPSADGLPKYELGATVPDYWIPFLPVAVDNGPLQLRRGRLPTVAGGPAGSCWPTRRSRSSSKNCRRKACTASIATLLAQPPRGLRLPL